MPDLTLHKNIGKVSRSNREKLNKHRSLVLWFTGLSGSGKSTLANVLEQKLYQMGFLTYVLDGDNIRHGISRNLGFSRDDRSENIRRIAEVAKLLVDSGIITIVAAISPYKNDRSMARSIFPHGDFVEIYCSAGLEVCETRDPKGLYSKAKEGLIKDFTGVSAPYEVPEKPDMVLDTGSISADESIEIIMRYLNSRKLLS